MATEYNYPTCYPQPVVPGADGPDEILPDWVVDMALQGWPPEEQVGPLHLARWAPRKIADHLDIPVDRVQSILSQLKQAWVGVATRNQLDIKVRDMAALEQDEAFLRSRFQVAPNPDLTIKYHSQILQTMQVRHRILDTIPAQRKALTETRQQSPARQEHLRRIHADPEARAALKLLAEKQLLPPTAMQPMPTPVQEPEVEILGPDD